jgi:hypothetical protein
MAHLPAGCGLGKCCLLPHRALGHCGDFYGFAGSKREKAARPRYRPLFHERPCVFPADWFSMP